eukprot:TRINITY_DN4173_c0_g1_i3.p1 TRINITY_DN4173_c0_g1~~TRINITY_DN4173_c0_g1_i3.p1  ORF type:complete len:198 (-),score=42.32 TRINITY_DN4173_c0_g1_i3:20-613(-)
MWQARVAVVNEAEELLLDAMVKVPVPVVSYLTALTGLRAEQFADAEPLEAVVAKIRALVPKNAILVGQGIESDIKWLQLVRGSDYGSSYDIAQLFRVRNPPSAAFSHQYFSLRHEVKHLLGVDIQETVHDPVQDALWSIRLWNRFRQATPAEVQALRTTLATSPQTPSFGMTNPTLDGVCMRPSQHCPCPKTNQKPS